MSFISKKKSVRYLVVIAPVLALSVACGGGQTGGSLDQAGSSNASGGGAGTVSSAAGAGATGSVAGSESGGSNASGGSAAAPGVAGGGLGGAMANGGSAGASVAGQGGTSGAVGESGAAGVSGAAGAGGATGTACANVNKGAHYVDSVAGNDAHEGTTPTTAWKSLTPLNQATFQPGDAICLFAGGSWTGQLAPKGSGTANAPIVIDQYGAGAKPRIAAASGNLQALLLQNVQYWEINHLEITNTQSGPGDFRGISVRGKDVGVLNHIYIRNSFVHDVTGQVKWIGGSTGDNQPPWVTFDAGWDASKRTGGIVVEVESTTGTKTWFNDVQIENNVVQDTSFAGIVFKQLDGGQGWGVRASHTDANFLPHTNIVVRGNYISQTNTKYGCNSIYMTGSQHVLIERNVCKDSGTSAIEAYNSDDVRIQYNETFGTVKKAGGADSNGIDSDRATTNAVIQYNYVHNNGDGILLCQFVFGDSVVRYNLILNNSRYGINLHSDKNTANQTYNNLISILGLSSGDLIGSSGGATYLATPYAVSNNIFHSTRAASVVATGTGVTYKNNLFSGVTAVGSAVQTGDPLFVDSSVRPNGGQSGPALGALQGFQLRAGSIAIDKGTAVANNGGVDFWGDPLYKGTADIGPFEHP